MSSKHPKKSLKVRKTISLEQKMEIIRLSEKNFRTIEIVDQTNFAESTIRGIVSRKEEIKDAYTSLQKRSVSNQ